jgi:hypothetical protein
MFTNAEKGKRVIIGGYSPHIYDLPSAFLDTGTVIGVKKWATEFPCKYWIGLDTGLIYKRDFADTDERYKDALKYVRDITVPKFMRRPNKSSEAFVPQDFGIWFDKATQNTVPTKWNKQLQFSNSSAMAAISLAIVMGAAEVVLFGVDFVGCKRADGSSYPKPNFWQEHEAGVNNLIRLFRNYIPIYKTHPESWLDCPYMEVA